MTQNSLTGYSDKELQAEIERRKQIARQQELERREQRASFLSTKIGILLELIPDHSRTSCNDTNAVNDERCTRCYLLCVKSSGFWDSDRDLNIAINKLSDL